MKLFVLAFISLAACGQGVSNNPFQSTPAAANQNLGGASSSGSSGSSSGGASSSGSSGSSSGNSPPLAVVGSITQSFGAGFPLFAHNRFYANQAPTSQILTVDFWSVDISNSKALTMAGQVNPTSPTEDSNVSDEEIMVLLSPSTVDQVFYAKSINPYGDCKNGLVSLDVTDMSNVVVQPVFTQCPAAFLSPTLALVGIPYAGGGYSGYQVLDLSGATPKVRGTVPVNSYSPVALSGNLAYFWNPLAIVDMSNLDEPVVLNTNIASYPSYPSLTGMDAPAPGFVVSADQQWAYVSLSYGTPDILLINLSDLSAIKIDLVPLDLTNNTINESGDAEAYNVGAALMGDRLAMSIWEGLALFDISNPGSPVQLGTALPGSAHFSDDGSLLYVSGPFGLQILSVP